MNKQTITELTTTGVRPGRGADRVLWAAQSLIAAVLLLASFPKIIREPTVVGNFAEMGFNSVATLMIGCVEIAGAIGLLVPRLSGLAALGVVGLLIGATIATTLDMGVAPALLPAALGVMAAIVARGRWYQTVGLARSVRAVLRR
ncbi:DoxX family protein [Micromonospora sp. NPDC005173]|uniref:DoxX family protein n=1 Tax=Micromonospora sp. NPDC005173 TaxID=3157165 RepID=UPI0033A5D6BB